MQRVDTRKSVNYKIKDRKFIYLFIILFIWFENHNKVYGEIVLLKQKEIFERIQSRVTPEVYKDLSFNGLSLV